MPADWWQSLGPSRPPTARGPELQSEDHARLLEALAELRREGMLIIALAGEIERRLACTESGARPPGGAPALARASSGADAFRAAIEAARLEGARLVARTALHLVNNDLTAAVGFGELALERLRGGRPVDPELLVQAIAGARRAARHLRALQQIARLEIEAGPADLQPVLDLALSRQPPPD